MHDAPSPHKSQRDDWLEFADDGEQDNPVLASDHDDHVDNDDDPVHTPRARRLMLLYRLRHRLSLYFYDLRMRLMAAYNRRQRRRAAATRRRESNRVFIVEAPAAKK